MQSENFNGPNTGRFTVNTGFCPLSAYSAGHFHKITGYCIILRWQGIMICWQSHRRETTVGRQYLTLQRQKVLYWLQAWNEKNSILVWRPEITRNAFKFNHRYIHPGMLARVCLCMWVIWLPEPTGHGLPDFCYVWHKSVLLRSQWSKILIDVKFIAPQKVLFLLTWGWAFSPVFRWVRFLPMLLLMKTPVTDTPAQRQGVHLELQASPGNELSAGSSPSW